jgi:glycolate oxidase iron-sulfur subunit
MRTSFEPSQLSDPHVADAATNLRRCVHCGFCLATCPTYLLLGDERDSPRGRIYLIKEMLETGRAPSPTVVTHIDRCLSCLACMTTCPSSVDYRRLVDEARARIEVSRVRPLGERLFRRLLSSVMASPQRFRRAIACAALGRTFRALLPQRLRAMLDLAPRNLESISAENRPGIFPAQGQRRMRVALLAGCVQPAVRSEINAAAVRLLNRLGVEVVVAQDAVCCGALAHHMGDTKQALTQAGATLRAWEREIRTGGLDAIAITTSGCGSVVKDYAHLFLSDPHLHEVAANVAKLARDVTELIAVLERPRPRPLPPLKVAYHAACSLQHGQRIKQLPKDLLTEAGFEVLEPAEAHICCGSAGTYNILQPEIAARLKARKLERIRALKPDILASGNVGCLMQLAQQDIVTLHTIELLDWAYGGPVPAALSNRIEALPAAALTAG